MNPAQLQTFAQAYAPAILAAMAQANPTLYDETADEWAVNTTMAMLAQIERAGIEGVQSYYVNREGGALRLTCEALGIRNTARAMQDYLDGE